MKAAETRRARGFRIAGIAAAVVLALLFAATFFGDEPLRRTLERNMNAKLKGYTASVGHAHLNLFGLSVTLRNVSVAQNANPDPPVLALPLLKASVHWKELLTLHLVADFLFEGPRLHVDRPQLLKEAADETPVKERGWQQALESIYPLKINLLRVEDGDLTYIDDQSSPPLKVEHLHIHATNIRNLHSKSHVYPSPVDVTGTILGSGRGSMKGHANFLAEPYPGVHVLFDLADVPLTPFRPLVARSNLSVKGGVVSTSGEAEIAPGVQFVDVRSLEVRKVVIDYLHAAATSDEEKRRAETVKKAVKSAGESSTADIRLQTLSITDSELGFVNRAKSPAYRVFLSGATITATNFSNGLRAGPASVHVTGKFMGTGPTEARATFRTPAKGADFDVAVSIRDTAMQGMNDLLRAYGRFDVTAGLFSFFCELKVRNGTVDGYVKPLFRDMKVYDARQDAEKSLFRKLYEKLVGGVAKLLENRPRREVATKTRIEGPIDSPKTDTLQMVLRLVENAFFHAILPGFDAELSREDRASAKSSR
ncbi:MAG TPA: DUF748 domain-containing protein [Thermoanaerobaculia bacterium]|nr:DUF748 domain-containing protein [Thermoanaerobaculia bacterium]